MKETKKEALTFCVRYVSGFRVAFGLVRLQTAGIPKSRMYPLVRL